MHGHQLHDGIGGKREESGEGQNTRRRQPCLPIQRGLSVPRSGLVGNKRYSLPTIRVIMYRERCVKLQISVRRQAAVLLTDPPTADHHHHHHHPHHHHLILGQ